MWTVRISADWLYYYHWLGFYSLGAKISHMMLSCLESVTLDNEHFVDFQIHQTDWQQCCRHTYRIVTHLMKMLLKMSFVPGGRGVLNTKSSASRRHQFQLQDVPRLSELKYWSHVCLDVCVQQSSDHLLVIIIHKIAKAGCVKTVQAPCDTDHIFGSIYPSFNTIYTLRWQKRVRELQDQTEPVVVISGN